MGGETDTRRLIVQAEIHNNVFCFVNVYERLTFFNLIKNELRKYHHDQLITGGDYNCTLDFTIDRTNSHLRHLYAHLHLH